jgi:hypothetical protein
MKRQLFPKTLVVLALAGSAYLTSRLLYTYLGAVFGWLQGAGEAQWQFEFTLAPAIAFLLALIALVVARLSKPPLARAFLASSGVAVLAPVLLTGLVFTHAY